MSAQIYQLLSSRFPTGFAPARVRLVPGQLYPLDKKHALMIEQSRQGSLFAAVVSTSGGRYRTELLPNLLSDLTGYGYFIAPRAIERTCHGLARTVWVELYSINTAMNNFERGRTDGYRH